MVRVTGTPRTVVNLAGGRLLSLPGPFSHARFVFSLPQVFFFWAFEAPTGQRDGDVYIYIYIHTYFHFYISLYIYIYVYIYISLLFREWNLYSKNGMSSPKSCSENTPELSESSVRETLIKMLPLVVVWRVKCCPIFSRPLLGSLSDAFSRKAGSAKKTSFPGIS